MSNSMSRRSRPPAGERVARGDRPSHRSGRAVDTVSGLDAAGSRASNWPAHSSYCYAGPWNANTTTSILPINNRHGPADDYRNAKRAQRRLGNAVLLTEDGYGHPTAADPSDCVDKSRVRYFADLATPLRGTVCRP